MVNRLKLVCLLLSHALRSLSSISDKSPFPQNLLWVGVETTAVVQPCLHHTKRGPRGHPSPLLPLAARLSHADLNPSCTATRIREPCGRQGQSGSPVARRSRVPEVKQWTPLETSNAVSRGERGAAAPAARQSAALGVREASGQIRGVEHVVRLHFWSHVGSRESPSHAPMALTGPEYLRVCCFRLRVWLRFVKAWRLGLTASVDGVTNAASLLRVNMEHASSSDPVQEHEGHSRFHGEPASAKPSSIKNAFVLFQGLIHGSLLYCYCNRYFLFLIFSLA